MSASHFCGSIVTLLMAAFECDRAPVSSQCRPATACRGDAIGPCQHPDPGDLEHPLCTPYQPDGTCASSAINCALLECNKTAPPCPSCASLSDCKAKGMIRCHDRMVEVIEAACGPSTAKTGACRVLAEGTADNCVDCGGLGLTANTVPCVDGSEFVVAINTTVLLLDSNPRLDAVPRLKGANYLTSLDISAAGISALAPSTIGGWDPTVTPPSLLFRLDFRGWGCAGGRAGVSTRRPPAFDTNSLFPFLNCR